ncbi:MAG: carbon-nitrogen hydrolase family protein [Bifidobacteriaceae bacterium]|jgi:predicted amidohydrolase|nr:carbon-nitrogen hydrolase family protein [Bifidobacteriaceae bacterium]
MNDVTVAVGQLTPGCHVEANWAQAAQLIARAAQLGASLLVLPETTMLAITPTAEFGRVARSAWPGWLDKLSDAARRHAIAVVAGGFEPAEDPARPYNTLAAVDRDGALVATQRKIHLYDAFSYRESDHVSAGAELPQVVELAGLSLGLVNCYELRFPEQARSLATQGAQVLVVAAAWMPGPLKEGHWKTLIRARAIENTAYVMAAGVTGSQGIGLSQVADPMGVVLAQAGETPMALAVAEISAERLAQVRATLPVLANRRIEVDLRLT